MMETSGAGSPGRVQPAQRRVGLMKLWLGLVLALALGAMITPLYSVRTPLEKQAR